MHPSTIAGYKAEIVHEVEGVTVRVGAEDGRVMLRVYAEVDEGIEERVLSIPPEAALCLSQSLLAVVQAIVARERHQTGNGEGP